MKNVILSGLLGIIMTTIGCAQNPEVTAVKKTIMAFSKAGDQNNATELDKYLDDNYRIVMNGLFGSEEVSVMSKSMYLSKIESKEFGGDDRKLTIENVVINGPTASAKVSFRGSKMTFISLITLINDKSGTWKLVTEVPIVQ